MHKPIKAIILDRDGTLIHDKPGRYLSKPEALRLYKNTAPALKILAEAGYKLFVVSNQSGIGRGYFTEQTARAINRRMTDSLKKTGVVIADIVFCPHAPDEKCACRKPLPKMGEDLIKKHGIKPAESYMVGDKLSDVKFGHALGMKTIFVKTGNGRHQLEKYGSKIQTEKIAADILAAAKWIAKYEIQN
ncbi:MAG: HAD family hydrolase [Elusimicrobiaceae bacterium]